MQDTSVSVLNIGCANGGLLKSLHELGFHDLCGVDPSPACVENVTRLGIEAQRASLFQPMTRRSFRCIILSHVLEHVQDLNEALQSINRSLNSGRQSCLYIDVPDASRYVDYMFAPFQDFNTEHINHFSQISLTNLMRSVGFTAAKQGENIIESSPNMPYPAIYGFWQKSIQYSSSFTLERDTEFFDKIKTYIDKSESKMDEIEEILKKVIGHSSEVIIWGTGQLAMKLLTETSLASAKIIRFVDGNPINHGKILLGVPICAPSQIHGISCPIMITTILHQKEIT